MKENSFEVQEPELNQAQPIEQPVPVPPVVEQPSEQVQIQEVQPVPTPTDIPQQTVEQTPIQDPIKKKGKGLLFVVIILIVLAVAGAAVYFFYFKKVSKKEVMDGTINAIFVNAQKYSKKVEDAFVIDYKKDIIGTEGFLKVSIETDDQEIKNQLIGLNSLTLNYNMNLDVKNLAGNGNFKLLENTNTVGTLDLLVQDKTFYFKSDLIDDVFKVDGKELIDWDALDVDKLPDYNVNVYSNILEKIRIYVKNAIKDDYLTQVEVNETIDGTEVKGLKTTLLLNEKNTKEIYKSIITSAKNDDQFINYMASITYKDKEEIKKSLEDAYNETDNSIRGITDSTINIYTTTKGSFLAFTLESNNNQVVTGVKRDNIITTKIYDEKDVIFEFDYNDKEREFTWTNKKKDDEIKRTYDGAPIVESKEEKIEQVKVKILDNGLRISIKGSSFDVVLEGTNTINGDNIKNDYSITGTSNNDTFKGTIKAQYSNKTQKVDSITKFDISTAKDYDSLTEAQQEAYSKQLETNLKKSVLGTLLYESMEVQEQPQYPIYDNCSPGLNCISPYE